MGPLSRYRSREADLQLQEPKPQDAAQESSASRLLCIDTVSGLLHRLVMQSLPKALVSILRNATLGLIRTPALPSLLQLASSGQALVAAVPTDCSSTSSSRVSTLSPRAKVAWTPNIPCAEHSSLISAEHADDLSKCRAASVTIHIID